MESAPGVPPIGLCAFADTRDGRVPTTFAPNTQVQAPVFTPANPPANTAASTRKIVPLPLPAAGVYPRVVTNDDLGAWPAPVVFNTSNADKRRELLAYWRTLTGGAMKLEFVGDDLREIVGTPEEVVVQKATALYDRYGFGVHCEDVSLWVEGSPHRDVMIKHTQADLHKFVGARAIYRVLIAMYSPAISDAPAQPCEHVLIWRGECHGRIVSGKIGPGIFGFDDCFAPDGQDDSFHAFKSQYVCPRADACRAWLSRGMFETHAPIRDWTGEWQ